MRILKYLSILIIFFIFSNNLWAISLKPKIIYVANAGLPVEMSLLVESLQKNMEKEKLAFFKETLQRLDGIYQSMSKEERFFITKSEIYKMLIRRKVKLNPRESSFDPSIIQNIDKTLNSDRKTYSSFSRWFIAAIKNDLRRLFDSAFFSKYLNEKRAGRKFSSKEIKSLHRKLSVLLPIYEEFSALPAGEYEAKIKTFMVSALEQIYQISNNLVTFSKFKPVQGPIESKKMLYFDRKEISPLEEIPDSKINKILSTIKPDPNYKSPELLPDPIDDWTPSEEPISLKKAEPFPTPDPDYISPEELPAPVDDWLNSL